MRPNPNLLIRGALSCALLTLFPSAQADQAVVVVPCPNERSVADEPLPHEVVRADPRTGIVFFDRSARKAHAGLLEFMDGGRSSGDAISVQKALCSLEEGASRLRNRSRLAWDERMLGYEVRQLLPSANLAGRVLERLILPADLEDSIADTLDYVYALDRYFSGG